MTYDLLEDDEPGDLFMDLPADFTDKLMERISADQRQRKFLRRAAVVLATALLVGGAYTLSARRGDAERKPAMAQGQLPRATTPALKATPAQEQISPREAVNPATFAPSPVVDHAAGGRGEGTPAVRRDPVLQATAPHNRINPQASVAPPEERTTIAQRQPDATETPAVHGIYVRRAASPGDSVKPGTPVTHVVGLVELPADALASTGLRPGDIVVTIDGKEIHDTSQAQAILKGRDHCTPLRIELLRDGKSLTFTIHPPGETDSNPCGAEP